MDESATTRQRAEDLLHPVMLPLLSEHRRLAAEDGHVGPVRLIETWRSLTAQQADYGLGRGALGNIIDKTKIVTWKRPGASWHNLLRWVRTCPDCQHLGDQHRGPSNAAAAVVRACTECPCVVFEDRLRTGTLHRIPASLAYHLALEEDGDEQAGSLEGFGTNRLDPKDVGRYKRLAQHGRELGLRAGADWGDFTHFELAGFPFATVEAMLNLQDGSLDTLVRPKVA
jgi:hypothetical protein